MNDQITNSGHVGFPNSTDLPAGNKVGTTTRGERVFTMKKTKEKGRRGCQSRMDWVKVLGY
jgi:hypothetical protein